jgi:hypothetical protein
MIHTGHYWYEMRAAGEKRRTIVPARYIENELEDLGSRPTDVHLSIFRYSDDIKEYREENNHRTKGYSGPAYADYVPIDIDGPGFEDLDQAVETARTAIDDLEGWGLSYEDVVVYFSGRRGFHILIPTRHFAEFDPHPRFHDLLFEMVVEIFHHGELVRKAEIQSSRPVISSDHIDFGPYTRLHMLRMPATIHEKTELWKVPIREHELMQGSPEEAAEAVKEAATDRRPKYRPDPNPNEKTSGLGERLQERMEEESLRYRKKSSAIGTMDINDYLTADDMRNLDKPGYGRFALNAKKTMKVLSGGLAEGESIEDMGGRHDALCHLVGKMKDQFGMPQDWAIGLLHHWNQANEDPLPEREFKQVIDDLYGR